MANLSHLLERDLDHVLAHSGGAWESLRSARIFLTGGTGFFGKWLLASSMHAHRKLGLESQVVVLTRDVRAFREAHPEYADLEPALSFHQGDVRTFAFPPGAFTHVIHAATAELIRNAPRTYSASARTSPYLAGRVPIETDRGSTGRLERMSAPARCEVRRRSACVGVRH